MIKIEESMNGYEDGSWFIGAGKYAGQNHYVGAAHWDWAFDHTDIIFPDATQLDIDLYYIASCTNWTFRRDFFEQWMSPHKDGYKRRLALMNKYDSQVLSDMFEKTMTKIYKNWIRFRCECSEVNVQVYDASKKYYDPFISFLQEYQEKVDTVFIETYDNDSIWDGITFEEAITSKSFQNY